MDDFTLYFVVVPMIIAIGVIAIIIAYCVWWVRYIKKRNARMRRFREWSKERHRIRAEETKHLNELKESNPELYRWELNRTLKRDRKYDRTRPTQYNPWTRTWI